jgi:hypothetical protein
MRNSDGSKREYSLIEDIMERVHCSFELIKSKDSSLNKIVVQNLNIIISGIKNLQNRKYVFIKNKLTFFNVEI